MTKTKGSRDFTSGRLFFPMLVFTLPIMASGILQMLYNAADKAVVGQFSGDEGAIGAIGSTASLTNLFVALAIGLSVGAGVAVAQRFGAHEEEGLSRAVHTIFIVGAIAGIAVGVLGVCLSRTVLGWIGTKDDLFESAALYMRIIFCGMPAKILYNFGASILRSVGNSKTPLITLGCAGLLNVLLNLLFVICFHMTVDGVAYATIISECIAAAAVWIVISRRRDSVRFRFRSLCVDRRVLRDILVIGIPSGIQSAMFSISNVLIHSAVNTFPTTTVSGNAVGGSLEDFTYVTMNSFYQTVLTVTGQNVGAKRPDRVRRALGFGLIQVVVAGLLMSYGCVLFADGLLALFIDETLEGAPLIFQAAKERNSIILTTYFLCGIMEVLTGNLRGKGHSFSPMVVSLVFCCFARVLWVVFVFPHLSYTLVSLFLCYPLSWLLAILSYAVILFALAQREKMRKNSEKFL